MAMLRALPNGTIWQFFSGFDQQNSSLYDPAATVALEFDESTNAPLLADIQANSALYSLPLVNGSAQLEKNGATVSIAAPTALYSLQSAILNGIPDATLKAAIVALWNGTAATAQQQKVLAYCLLRLHQAGVI